MISASGAMGMDRRTRRPGQIRTSSRRWPSVLASAAGSEPLTIRQYVESTAPPLLSRRNDDPRWWASVERGAQVLLRPVDPVADRDTELVRGAKRPVRLGGRRSCQQYDVRRAARDDLLGLLRIGDQPDRSTGDPGLVSDPAGELHLVAGPCLL